MNKKFVLVVIAVVTFIGLIGWYSIIKMNQPKISCNDVKKFEVARFSVKTSIDTSYVGITTLEQKDKSVKCMATIAFNNQLGFDINPTSITFDYQLLLSDDNKNTTINYDTNAIYNAFKQSIGNYEVYKNVLFESYAYNKYIYVLRHDGKHETLKYGNNKIDSIYGAIEVSNEIIINNKSAFVYSMENFDQFCENAEGCRITNIVILESDGGWSKPFKPMHNIIPLDGKITLGADPANGVTIMLINPNDEDFGVGYEFEYK